jgi:hypothetical protein
VLKSLELLQNNAIEGSLIEDLLVDNTRLEVPIFGNDYRRREPLHYYVMRHKSSLRQPGKFLLQCVILLLVVAVQHASAADDTRDIVYKRTTICVENGEPTRITFPGELGFSFQYKSRYFERLGAMQRKDNTVVIIPRLREESFDMPFWLKNHSTFLIRLTSSSLECQRSEDVQIVESPSESLSGDDSKHVYERTKICLKPGRAIQVIFPMKIELINHWFRNPEDCPNPSATKQGNVATIAIDRAQRSCEVLFFLNNEGQETPDVYAITFESNQSNCQQPSSVRIVAPEQNRQ